MRNRAVGEFVDRVVSAYRELTEAPGGLAISEKSPWLSEEGACWGGGAPGPFISIWGKPLPLVISTTLGPEEFEFR